MVHVDDDDIVRIAGEIKRYLEAHPNAADSLEGIVQWWLKRQRFHDAADVVQSALDYLLEKGIVSRQTTAGGWSIYGSRFMASGVDPDTSYENTD